MTTKNGTREPAYIYKFEHPTKLQVPGVVMTCNGCDRVIFQDENYSLETYNANAGYCRDCDVVNRAETASLIFPKHYTVRGAR